MQEVSWISIFELVLPEKELSFVTVLVLMCPGPDTSIPGKGKSGEKIF